MIINTAVSTQERNSEERSTRVHYREIWQMQTCISLPNIAGFGGEEKIQGHRLIKKTKQNKTTKL